MCFCRNYLTNNALLLIQTAYPRGLCSWWVQFWYMYARLFSTSEQVFVTSVLCNLYCCLLISKHDNLALDPLVQICALLTQPPSTWPKHWLLAKTNVWLCAGLLHTVCGDHADCCCSVFHLKNLLAWLYSTQNTLSASLRSSLHSNVSLWQDWQPQNTGISF